MCASCRAYEGVLSSKVFGCGIAFEIYQAWVRGPSEAEEFSKTYTQVLIVDNVESSGCSEDLKSAV